MKIGITYNLKDDLSPKAIIDSESYEEFDTPNTINAICDVLEKNGYETAKLGSDIDIVDKLKQEGIDFVFNIAEGHIGRNRESHIPSILEMLNIPYSGSDPLTLSLTLDKNMTKKIALQAGIPVPRYKIVQAICDLHGLESRLSYPLVTKPAWEGSSKGIYDSSKVFTKKELEISIKLLLDKYPNQPLLVEEYIEGREITVGVIGNNNPDILGLMEIVNKKTPGEDIFYSLETKRNWKELVEYKSPPDLDRVLNNHIRYRALTAFKEFGCRDIARIDFRISEKRNKLFMLEVNPLPGLSPEYADLTIMAKAQGISYEKLVLSILNHALSRYKNERGSLTHETI
ncbi:MAG: D-alanine--D-alanine ligase [Candidatus Omnitrophica bacterium]|nr:D-alanine--D-alanine ligase [Candidatus Omnitrophota bacterium]